MLFLTTLSKDFHFLLELVNFLNYDNVKHKQSVILEDVNDNLESISITAKFFKRSHTSVINCININSLFKDISKLLV